MNKDMSLEFKEEKKESKNKSYVIVGVLYAIVIILSVFLYLGLKHQKQVVKDNLDKKEINDSIIDDLDSFEESGINE